jgi:hypothetical protein
VLDESDVPLTPTAQADVREPISSSCTANPFNADGASCQGGAVGTPFLLFTNGTGPLSLFGDAYQSTTPTTGGPSAVTESSATLTGSVDPNGAAVEVSFQFGTTTAYGQSTAPQKLGPDDAVDTFSAALSGLPAATVIHYRAVATSDFGTVFGADETVTTSSPPPPGRISVGQAKVKGSTATVPVSCKGATSCQVSLGLTAKETLIGKRIIAVSAGKPNGKRRHKVVKLGGATATVGAGKTVRIKVKLNRTGRGLLSKRRHFKAKLTVTQRSGGKTVVVVHRTLTFRASSGRHHKR